MSQDAILSHIRVPVAKFDLAAKYVMVKPGLSFELSMVHTKFRRNRPTAAGSWKEDCKGFLPI